MDRRRARGAQAAEDEPPALPSRFWLRCFTAQQLFQRQQSLRVYQLQQSQFEMEALLLLVAEIVVRAQHDLQEARRGLLR